MGERQKWEISFWTGVVMFAATILFGLMLDYSVAHKAPLILTETCAWATVISFVLTVLAFGSAAILRSKAERMTLMADMLGTLKAVAEAELDEMPPAWPDAEPRRMFILSPEDMQKVKAAIAKAEGKED